MKVISIYRLRGHVYGWLKPLLHIGGFWRRSVAVRKLWMNAVERHKAQTQPWVNDAERHWAPIAAVAVRKFWNVQNFRRRASVKYLSFMERGRASSIVGTRTGTAVSRHRAQRKLDWRLSCDCRQHTAFIDAPRRWYYASMRFLKFWVTTGDGLATIVCASARSVTPHGGLTTLRHNSATFCCAPWRCSAIIDAQSRSTELSGGLNVIIYNSWNLIRLYRDWSKLCKFRFHWLIFNDLAHNEIVFNRLVTSKCVFISDAGNHDWMILLKYYRPFISAPDHW